MPPLAFFPSTGLSQFGQWQTWAGAESSSSSCSKVQLSHGFRQGEQFNLRCGLKMSVICKVAPLIIVIILLGAWYVSSPQFLKSNDIFSLVWQGRTKGSDDSLHQWEVARPRCGLPQLHDRGAGPTEKKKFLCTITSVVGCLYQKKIYVHRFCTPSRQSLVVSKENLCSQFWCIFTSTSFIQVVEWLWLDNVYEMCGGELE